MSEVRHIKEIYGNMKNECAKKMTHDSLFTGIGGLKSLQISIVPQVAYEIFKAIEKVEQINN